MKNITFSADERAIEAARERAREERTTLNEAFRLWLDTYGRRPRSADDLCVFLERVRRYAGTGGRRFTREELNER